MTNGSYRFTEHTGDVAISAEAPSLEELLAQLAYGMVAWMFPDGVAPGAAFGEHITAEGADHEDLVVDWLGKVLNVCLVKKAGLVRIEKLQLTAKPLLLEAYVSFVMAEAVDEIKAVTYHGLSTEFCDGVWQATVVVDL